MTEPKKIKAYLVAGGKYHDIDYEELLRQEQSL